MGWDLELPKGLELPREIDPVCEDLFDPTYRYRKRFPVVPYRYAVQGPKAEWSFIDEKTNGGDTGEGIEALIMQRPASGPQGSVLELLF